MHRHRRRPEIRHIAPLAERLRRIRQPLDATVAQANALVEGRYLLVDEPDVPELRRVAQAMNGMVERHHAHGVRALDRRRGVRLHTHLAETAEEDAFCQEAFGCRPTEYLEQLGWLDDDVWCAHCVHLSPEEILTTLAARRLGKPVKYTETRSESLMAAHHGRDQVQTLTLAADKDGKGQRHLRELDARLRGAPGDVSFRGYAEFVVVFSVVWIASSTTVCQSTGMLKPNRFTAGYSPDWRRRAARRKSVWRI
mgnify:CR=1 FL=1